jgi:hypothetical protein
VSKLLFLSLGILGLAQALCAEEIFGSLQGCGHYKIAGIIRKSKSFGVDIVVNEKTQSEYNFKPAAGELPRFVSIFDVPVSFEADVVSLDGTKGLLANGANFRPILPNPLDPRKSSGFIKLKERNCEIKK